LILYYIGQNFVDLILHMILVDWIA